MELSFNQRACKLIAKGRLAQARTLLEAAVHKMPTGWTPVREEGDSVTIAFWNQEEFLAYTNHHEEQLSKMLLWAGESYSRAWHLLAVIASKQKRFEDALFALDCGLELEDHPEVWSERGYVLGQLKRHEESLKCYVRAASARDWAPPSEIARAFRGQGVELVELDRLDEAEDVLRRSLELEPDSRIARGELEYIAGLRHRREEQKDEVPWFLHSFVNPPTDPVTIRLLALVEDLPSIPGPKTVESDNYSRISDAFIKRGWVGFEEEFDRIVPRDRPDYEDIKRDLLREPIFNMRAQRNLADIMLGNKTVDELFDGLAEQREEREKQRPD